jgi:HSP20 family protein
MTTQEKSKTAVARWAPWAELAWPRSWSPFLDSAWNFLPDTTAPLGALEERDDEFVLELDVPGVDRKDIAVDVTGRRVSVHGTRTAKQRDGVLRHSTVSTGTFAYEVTLPAPIEDGRVSAMLKDGVLTVTIPKGSEAKTTKIEVK